MLRDVIEAQPLGGHRLALTLGDGVRGEVDVTELIDFAGVFEPLGYPEDFARVIVDPDLGTVCQPEADLDQQAQYSKVTGSRRG